MARDKNMYLFAVDDLLRHRYDQPSIGLLLCAQRIGWSLNKPCAT
jgi:hypothetical protein